MWINYSTLEKLSDSNLIENIDKLDMQVLILQGPSGCGKTLLLKSMQRDPARMLRIYSVDEIIEYLKEQPPMQVRAEALEDSFSSFPIVAIDDADMLSAHQLAAAAVEYTLRRVVFDRLIILSGISCTKRLGRYLKNMPLTVFEWIDDCEA